MSAISSPSSRTGAAPILARLTASGVVAVLRSADATRLGPVCEVLAAAGIRALEVTLTTAGAVDAIAALRAAHRADDVVIGAGSVLSAVDAEACLEAGAQFLVSPIAAPDVVAAARLAGVPALPGAFTPTEICAAYYGGADAVKVFPAAALSPRFIADVHGPLPGVPLVPTGGIGLNDVEAWLRAGALAVGLGGALQGDACASDGDLDALADRARRAAAAVLNARS